MRQVWGTHNYIIELEKGYMEVTSFARCYGESQTVWRRTIPWSAIVWC